MGFPFYAMRAALAPALGGFKVIYTGPAALGLPPGWRLYGPRSYTYKAGA